MRTQWKLIKIMINIFLDDDDTSDYLNSTQGVSNIWTWSLSSIVESVKTENLWQVITKEIFIGLECVRAVKARMKISMKPKGLKFNF